jgi:hypothetical protein
MSITIGKNSLNSLNVIDLSLMWISAYIVSQVDEYLLHRPFPLRLLALLELW